MELQEANSILSRNGVKVYPINVGGKFKIVTELNGKKKTFNKLLTEKELNIQTNKNPLVLTIIHLAKQIRENNY